MAKILMVLDGSYRYSVGTVGDPDFTYITLVAALEEGNRHQVTKAHRGTDASPGVIQNFNFKTSLPPLGLDLFDFDVLWLIGKEGRNGFNSATPSGKGLGDPGVPAMVEQLAEIARFMQAGGGVFATGDHDSIGSIMCGHIPRVRAMRAWYGENDASSPMETDFPTFPRNYPRSSAGRADTTQRSALSDYSGDANLVYFENQSDSTPQTITAKLPVHPILRRGDTVLSVFPDHMHEGKVLADVGGDYDYTTSIPIGAESFVEFPLVAGNREMPRIIASGQSTPYTNKMVPNVTLDSNTEMTGMKEVDTFSVYDGRQAGVGRVVTGSTFHHYVDINLTGDSAVDANEALKSGPDTRDNQGFAYATPSVPGAFADIKAVFVNIADWLARPKPAITIVLERSTFSQDEANAQPQYDGVILVYVDGLKPSQFPGGPLDDLTPSAMDLGNWAPDLTFAEPAGLSIVPIGVDSDDPALPERLQRFTFSYGLTINAASAFAFAETFNTIQLDAVLDALEVSAPLTDRAWIQLVKSANPFSLDLDNNDTAWLSSDLKIFPVVAGGGVSIAGHSLAANATRNVALDFLKDVVDDISIADFVDLPSGQQQSALSPIPQTTVNPKKNVYNFALARVRLSPDGADANDVRVFFRIVPSPTTAALTYHDSGGGPTGSYEKTAGGWAAPGRNNAHTDWVSFPVVAQARNPAFNSQTDDNNEKNVGAGQSVIFGALIDNNLNDNYLSANPDGSGGMKSLPDLMTGEHQCIVAQIEFPGAPIPDGATPYASDKLAQRNIAFSEIANPGLDASRMAFHTFEIEAAPGLISETLPPDELLLDWRGPVPDGTEVRIYVSGWQAADVIALADRFYARHDIREVDAQTIALPGGGTRYVPLPPSQQRWTGVLIADFPIGVKRGQRFDLAVRQITNRRRLVEPPPPKVTQISQEEAARLLAAQVPGFAEAAPPRGAFDLGGNRTLVTDLRIFDDEGDHALVIEHPDPAAVAAASAQSGIWRETIGAFQLGIPVSVKGAMLPYHLQLLSVMRWRAEQMKPNGRWHATFHRYLALLADKVRALGGDPFAVPATPDGNFPMPGDDCGPDGPGENGPRGDMAGHGWHAWHWLILVLLALILLVLLLLLMRMH
jgi:hypothetical protein